MEKNQEDASEYIIDSLSHGVEWTQQNYSEHPTTVRFSGLWSPTSGLDRPGT